MELKEGDVPPAMELISGRDETRIQVFWSQFPFTTKCGLSVVVWNAHPTFDNISTLETSYSISSFLLNLHASWADKSHFWWKNLLKERTLLHSNKPFKHAALQAFTLDSIVRW